MTKRGKRVVAWVVALAATAWVLFQSRSDDNPLPATPALTAEDPRPAAYPDERKQASGDDGARAAPVVPLGSQDEAGRTAPSLLLSAAWGSGLHELGRERPSEGNPEGPMSFAIDGAGHLVVLDQVNGRVVRYDSEGRPANAFPLPQQAPQDLAFGNGGTLAVLDRLAGRSVAIVTADGRVAGELPLTGKGLAEGGAATGVFIDGESVYVEREHGSLVRIGDTHGKPDPERPEIPGRPTRDGLSYISALIVDAPVGRVTVTSIERASMNHRFTRELRLANRVLALLLLDTDATGVIYVAALLELDSGAGSRVEVLCLNPASGRPTGSARLPANTSQEETFRDLVVHDGGGVIYAKRSERGVTYERWHCR
jgi:hypothetical protein